MTTRDALFSDLRRMLRSPEAEGPLDKLYELTAGDDPEPWRSLVWFLRGVWAANGMSTRTTAELIERARAEANAHAADGRVE
ncbi:hypothetical protein [Pseudomonas sp.]|uniref:hypothetical protein n=1 Tax=Pseudomonas sp. TaxID=306 RepID=UPI0029124685|nr:hypothetical protein [Pseudomonas sp.]MDU4254498.1 hypothetical protein [Pseudomonas sp.]